MDLDKLLYSLIPLLIIIAISWFFSYLGSKANKARQEAETQSGAGSDSRERLLDLISFEDDEDEEEFIGSRHPHAEEPPMNQHGKFADWEAVHRKGAPVVTPDPIKPKWWGA